MSQKPTIVFVPGAWHNISTWDKVTAPLEAQQYKCICVPLPSTMGNPSTTLLEDVDAVRNVILAEIAQGHDVVVVVHSYGGLVGSSAIKGLTEKPLSASPSATQTTGHVIGLVMMATGFATTGISFIDHVGGKPPPFWKADTENGFAVIIADVRELFYHDLPEEEGNLYVSRLEKQALKVLMEGGEHVYSGWKDVPVWYLMTTDDRTYPVEAQKFVVQLARDGGGDVTMREVESSHSPMLSKPKETVEFILEAVAALKR